MVFGAFGRDLQTADLQQTLRAAKLQKEVLKQASRGHEWYKNGATDEGMKLVLEHQAPRC